MLDYMLEGDDLLAQLSSVFHMCAVAWGLRTRTKQGAGGQIGMGHTP